MARTIKVVYENGMFRPLEPVYLNEGTELELHIPFEAGLTAPAELEGALRELGKWFDQMTDEELAEWDANVLGPRRATDRNLKREKS